MATAAFQADTFQNNAFQTIGAIVYTADLSEALALSENLGTLYKSVVGINESVAEDESLLGYLLLATSLSESVSLAESFWITIHYRVV